MSSFHTSSATDQVAKHLREQLRLRVWVDTMPGGENLARQLGVGRMTVEAALIQLEQEGILQRQGPRRRRKITLHEQPIRSTRLRVAYLLYEPSDQSLDYLIDSKNKLEESGHIVFFAPSSLTEIKMDVNRLAQMVEKTAADAWVVGAGTRDILEWFIQRKIPVFARFGRRRKLKIAGIGPDHIPALVKATQRLIDLGHQRIVLLDSLLKISDPGTLGTAFLDVLAAKNIHAGAYNLPGWEGGPEGLYAYLEGSFAVSPPTAIIACSSSNYFACLHFLLNRGVRVPDGISLICFDDDPQFKSFQPSVAHTRWDRRPVINRIVRWVNNVSQGKLDTRQTHIKVEFVEGGTIGQVPEY